MALVGGSSLKIDAVSPPWPADKTYIKQHISDEDCERLDACGSILDSLGNRWEALERLAAEVRLK